MIRRLRDVRKIGKCAQVNRLGVALPLVSIIWKKRKLAPVALQAQ
jgi:hypothetical protein